MDTVKSNLIYGVLFLLPVAVIVLLIAKLVDVLAAIAKPLGLDSLAGAFLALLIAIGLLLLVCFVAGAAVRTRIGSWSAERLDALLNPIPGYQIVANVVRGFKSEEVAYPPALVQLHDAGVAALGFVIEEHDNGEMVVFVPTSPTVTIGSVYLVKAERVTLLQSSSLEMLNCVSQWGIDSSKLIRR